MTDLEKKFFGLLQAAVQHRASDVHLSTGTPPGLRTGGKIVSVNLPPFSPEEMAEVCKLLTSNPDSYNTLRELDGTFEVSGVGRFRYSLFRCKTGVAITLRLIATQVPSLDGMKLPVVLKTFCELDRGMVLITGASGNGKSSTLAAILDYINSNQQLHIITIEDPVEFIHPQKKCRISQREVGRDTDSFSSALRSALRQDPDIIVLSEIRDYETLDIALKAAETGNLIFASVHTTDTVKTIEHLISLFPAECAANARHRLSDNLQAVISQRLLNGQTPGTKVVAQEILINNSQIKECIIDEQRTFEIPTFIEKGYGSNGMQTFDQHLIQLAKEGAISNDAAATSATHPGDVERNLSLGGQAFAIEDNTRSFQTQMEGSPLSFENTGETLQQPPSFSPPPSATKPVAPAPGPAVKFSPPPSAAPRPAASPPGAPPSAPPSAGPPKGPPTPPPGTKPPKVA